MKERLKTWREERKKGTFKHQERTKVEKMGYTTGVNYSKLDSKEIDMVTDRGGTSTPIKDNLGFGLYINSYDPKSGAFRAVSNDQGTDELLGLGKPANNSDIIWHQFRQALKPGALEEQNRTEENTIIDESTKKSALKGTKAISDGKLTSIRREMISNKQTLNTISWCDSGLKVAQSMWEKETVTDANDDFWALLGTPNGHSAAWILMDHGHKLGKTVDIESITYEKNALTIKYNRSYAVDSVSTLKL